MTSVDPIHEERIQKRQNNEDKDRPLLGKPKTQWETTEMNLVEGLHEDNTEEIGDHKPDGKEHEHQTDVLMPMHMRGSF